MPYTRFAIQQGRYDYNDPERSADLSLKHVLIVRRTVEAISKDRVSSTYGVCAGNLGHRRWDREAASTARACDRSRFAFRWQFEPPIGSRVVCHERNESGRRPEQNRLNCIEVALADFDRHRSALLRLKLPTRRKWRRGDFLGGTVLRAFQSGETIWSRDRVNFPNGLPWLLGVRRFTTA